MSRNYDGFGRVLPRSLTKEPMGQCLRIVVDTLVLKAIRLVQDQDLPGSLCTDLRQDFHDMRRMIGGLGRGDIYHMQQENGGSYFFECRAERIHKSRGQVSNESHRVADQHT